jgi:hypothetical protein
MNIQKSGAFSALGLAMCLALAGGATGCGGGDVVYDPIEESTLLVVNQSDFAIVELYLTPVGSPDWGPNLVAGRELFPGEDVLLTDVPCDSYDVMMVAEDGVTCELGAVDMCFDDATWVVDNHTCAGFFNKPEN